jgi:hypothetical protein
MAGVQMGGSAESARGPGAALIGVVIGSTPV